jgi:SAM-dependent methyltransferase
MRMHLRRKQSRPTTDDWTGLLARRWSTVPAGQGRRSTHELQFLDDDALLAFWRGIRDAEGAEEERGWYRQRYAEFVRGARILDIGCGLALDTLTFAEWGADVVCADLAGSNVRLVSRVAGLLGVADRVEVVHLGSTEDVATLPRDFDAIFALGSLHHAPREVVEPEVRELGTHLKVGGHWFQLAYPRARWEREGSPPFDKWGEMTDGYGTPWAEWYDSAKLLELLAPTPFEVVFEHEWHNQDFNWMELVRTSEG